MKEFIVSVRKLTDIDLMHEACEMTFNGKSKQTLLSIYKSEHSPVRTQIFWVKFTNIPLYISTHLLRHHVGSVPFQLTCRSDRDGANPGLKDKIESICDLVNSGNIDSALEGLKWLPDNVDRYTPVNLGLLLNAQSIIDMSKLRFCLQAAEETRIVFKRFKDELGKVDPELASMMVRKCVYRGGICGEPRCCGFNNTPAFKTELKEYLSNFSQKQQGYLAKDC